MGKRPLIILVSLILFLTACSRTPTLKNSDTLKIGFIAPLTSDMAPAGEMLRRTVLDYFEENPTWSNRKVELIVEDGKCSPQEGASAAKKLIEANRVEILLASGCSGTNLGVAPILTESKVVGFAPLSTSPELSGVSKYFFRVAPSDALGGVIMSQAVADEGYTKIALITENTDFATAYANKIRENFEGEIVVDEYYNFGQTDFKTHIQKAKDKGAEAIVHMNQSPTTAGFMAKQNRELGANFQIFSNDGTAGVEFFKIAKDAAEGQLIVITSPDSKSSDVSAAYKKYKEKYTDLSFDAYHILQLDLLNILKEAVSSVGTNGDDLVDYLRMVKHKGMSGVFTFDKDGNPSITPSVLIAKDGEFILKK